MTLLPRALIGFIAFAFFMTGAMVALYWATWGIAFALRPLMGDNLELAKACAVIVVIVSLSGGIAAGLTSPFRSTGVSNGKRSRSGY